MADVKWIKITTDIFDDEKILLIESLPDADSIIVIWFKLLCLAGRQNNKGVFLINEQVAYTVEMLSAIFRRKESTVKHALETFARLGLIEFIEGVITIPNWEKHQHLDTIEKNQKYMRNYMAKYRERQRDIVCKVNSKVNSKVNCKTAVNSADIDIDIDKEIEKENILKEKDKENLYKIENSKSDDPKNGSHTLSFFEIYENENKQIDRLPFSELHESEDDTLAEKPTADKKTAPVRHRYGEYKNVLLSDEQLAKLKKEFPEDWEKRIENLSEYIASTGKQYKDFLATIRKWAKNEKGEVKSNAKDNRGNQSEFANIGTWV